jgi:hypothetical protein
MPGKDLSVGDQDIFDVLGSVDEYATPGTGAQGYDVSILTGAGGQEAEGIPAILR